MTDKLTKEQARFFLKCLVEKDPDAWEQIILSEWPTGSLLVVAKRADLQDHLNEDQMKMFVKNIANEGASDFLVNSAIHISNCNKCLELYKQEWEADEEELHEEAVSAAKRLDLSSFQEDVDHSGVFPQIQPIEPKDRPMVTIQKDGHLAPNDPPMTEKITPVLAKSAPSSSRRKGFGAFAAGVATAACVGLGFLFLQQDKQQGNQPWITPGLPSVASSSPPFHPSALPSDSDIPPPPPAKEWGAGEQNITKFVDEFSGNNRIHEYEKDRELVFAMVNCHASHQRLPSNEGYFSIKCEIKGRHYANNVFTLDNKVSKLLAHLSQATDLYLSEIDKTKILFLITGYADSPVPSVSQLLKAASGTTCHNKYDPSQFLKLIAGYRININQELACARGDQAILFMEERPEFRGYEKKLFYVVDTTEKNTSGLFRGVDIELGIRVKSGDVARYVNLVYKKRFQEMKNELLRNGFDFKNPEPNEEDAGTVGCANCLAGAPQKPAEAVVASAGSPASSALATGYEYKPRFNCEDVASAIKAYGRVPDSMVCDFMMQKKSIHDCRLVLPHEINKIENYCRATLHIK